MQYNVNNDTIRLVVKPNLNVSSTINVQVAAKVISRFTFGFVVRDLIECPWPSGRSHTPYDPGCPCVAGGYRVISSSYEWSGQERARRELPARRGRVRQNGRAGGGLLRRFGPNSSPGQV